MMETVEQVSWWTADGYPREQVLTVDIGTGDVIASSNPIPDGAKSLTEAEYRKAVKSLAAAHTKIRAERYIAEVEAWDKAVEALTEALGPTTPKPAIALLVTGNLGPRPTSKAD